MNLKKTVAIAAAAGALAAISVPAMAFENEFHGMYKMKYFITNAELGGSNYIFGSTAPLTVGESRTSNYFEQRARLQYIAKANDDLRLVTHFEIDSVFGDKAQASATRGSGGAMESDAVNLETKHVFLDFKIPSTPTRVTAGIQPIKDVFKGVFLDADIAGVNTVTKLGAATIGLGYFRAYDQSYFSTNRPKGVDNLDILAASANFAVNKNFNLGGAYYWYGDSRNTAYATTGTGTLNIHVLGLNADAKIGKSTLSGFVAHQQGSQKGTALTPQSTEFTGWAANVAAKIPVGPGNFRTAFLYTSGDDQRDGINTSWQGITQTQNLTASSAANSYTESNMMLLNRAPGMGGTSTDYSLAYNTDNRQQGMWLYTLGYDAAITPKLYANANLGFLWCARNNPNKPADVGSGIRGGSNFQGTEINVETGYKMYDNLTASLQAAYVILGGYYENTGRGHNGLKATPDDPYTIRTVLSYAF